MLPVGVIRPMYLSDIATPAIVLPVEDFGSPFLVLGSGDDAVACFIGEQHTFETMPAAGTRNWRGVALERMDIEVDLDGAYSLDAKYPMLGAVVRTGTQLQLVAKAKDAHGFSDTRRFVLKDGLPEGAEGLTFAFPNWRLVLRDGDRVLYERKFTATEYAK